MKINNTKRVKQKIELMFEMYNYSAVVNMILTNYIGTASVIPTNLEELRKEANEIVEKMKNDGVNPYSIEKTMMVLVIRSMLDEALFDASNEIYQFFLHWICEESRVFTLEEMNENPYIRDIKFKGKQHGDFEFKYESYMPFELQIYDIPKRIKETFVDIPRIGCFSEKYEYPAIIQKSIRSAWMSVSPNEIFTVQEHIDMAKGKVLTLGCGMGYFAYMASLKEEVTSITIVEREQSVIELFESIILPQFQNKDKIKVIKADAIDFMRNLEDGEYDYCFADIWIGITDIEPYFAIKELGRKLKKTKISYWIEKSFAILLEAYVFEEIMRIFYESEGINNPLADCIIPPEQYRNENYIQRLLFNEEISKPEHIDFYLNPDNLIKLIDETDIIY